MYEAVRRMCEKHAAEVAVAARRDWPNAATFKTEWRGFEQCSDERGWANLFPCVLCRAPAEFAFEVRDEKPRLIIIRTGSVA